MHTLRTLPACIPGIFIFVLFFCSAVLTHAQFQIPGGASAQIEIDPLYPKPGETFTARLTDYGNSLGNGKVTWIIDGVPVNTSGNQKSVSLTAPALGTPITIRVRTAASSDGPVLTIVPSAIDIITESNTAAPYFFKGRLVPSTGSTAHIVAIPHLYTKKGTPIAAADIAYTWSVDNAILGNEKTASLYTTLSNAGPSLVRLSAEARAYNITHEIAFYIESTEPVLEFYTYNPLTGLSHNAIQNNYAEAVREITVRAQPYAMPRTIYSNADAAWSINGERTENVGADPELITLKGGEGGGISDIGYSIRNLSALSQYAANLFRVEFQ